MYKTECQNDNIYLSSDNLLEWVRSKVNIEMDKYYNSLERLITHEEYKDCDYLSMALITPPLILGILPLPKWWTFLIVVIRDLPGSRFVFFSDRDCGVLKSNVNFVCVGSKDLNMKCAKNLKYTLIGIGKKREYTSFDWGTGKLSDTYKIPKTKSQCENCKSFGFKYKKCGNCKKNRYCSKSCQSSDWKNHKFVCK
jgi:hypothetical protein